MWILDKIAFRGHVFWADRSIDFNKDDDLLPQIITLQLHILAWANSSLFVFWHHDWKLFDIFKEM